MATGIVRTFNQNKGYGFISPDDGGKDLHVQGTAVQAGSSAAMKEGVHVTYTPTDGPTGPRATAVQIMSETATVAHHAIAQADPASDGARSAHSDSAGTTRRESAHVDAVKN